MYDNQSKGLSYTSGFFILIAFTIGAIMLAAEVSGAVFHAMTGKVYNSKLIPSASDGNALRSMHVINNLIGFLLPAIVTANLLHKRPFSLMGFTGRIKRDQWGLTVLIVGISLIVATSMAWFNNQIPIPASWKIEFDQMEIEYNRHVEAIVIMKDVGDYMVALIVMAFMPAFCEEALFRGGMQNFLSRGTGKPWLAIIVVSLIFSLAHFSFYGFLSRLFLGIVLGALYQYSGRLWLCILAHFLNNALALTILFSSTQNGKPASEAIKVNPATWWGILLLPIVIGLFILFKRTSANNRDWSNQ